jgi:hypothetical protein
LSRAYSNNGKRGLPIVVLGTESYRHREYGKVDKPILKIVGWTQAAPPTPAIAPPAPKAGPPAADTKAAPSRETGPREFAPVEVYDEDSFG